MVWYRALELFQEVVERKTKTFLGKSWMVYKDPNVKDGPSYRHLVVVRKKKKKREGSEDEYQKFLPCHICDKVKKKKKKASPYSWYSPLAAKIPNNPTIRWACGRKPSSRARLTPGFPPQHTKPRLRSWCHDLFQNWATELDSRSWLNQGGYQIGLKNSETDLGRPRHRQMGWMRWAMEAQVKM